MNKEKDKENVISDTKQRGWENTVRKKNFIDYKKIEALKFDLLRLESRRAQVKIVDDKKKLALIENKIKFKREKLNDYFSKYAVDEESREEL